MLEMISEITGTHMHQNFRIKSAPLIKFLNMIDPEKDPLIQFEIKHDSTQEKTLAQGKISSGTRVFMKFQMILEAVKLS
jgi:hypothetical protein